MSAEPTQKIAYSLDEVSDLTGVTVRRLRDGCRAEEIPHTLYRGQRVMTPQQVARFLAANEVAVPVSADADELEGFRRKVADRLARKTGRAA